MKKIINGKKYDTETAQELCFRGWWDESINRYQKEILYRKKTGEFFLFNEKWSTWGNIYEYTLIEPMSLEDAKTWVERFRNEFYEEIFGEVEE